MHKIGTTHRLAMGLGSAALLVGVLAGPAFAGTVAQTITQGGLTASVANFAFPSVAYQNEAHDVSGTMVVTADDSRGTSLGWSVTVQGSAFVYAGALVGTNIPAANFALTSAAEPVLVAGQVVDLTASTGPQIPIEGIVYGSLASPLKTIRATAAYGAGTYTQDLGVTLTIPAQSKVGTYTGTLTTTISATP
jgi:putative surface cell wall-binding protein